LGSGRLIEQPGAHGRRSVIANEPQLRAGRTTAVPHVELDEGTGFEMTVATQGHQHVARDVADALAVVRAHGLRLTRARRLVLEALFAVDRPVRAEEIAAGPDGLLPASDLASVYRNLEALERIGLVRHIHFGHGAGLYELARAQRYEYALCERCRTVTAVAAAELDPVRRLLEQQLGIEPHFTHFPIVGLCRGCRRADDDPAQERRNGHAHP
jgi:Fur family ferric uptake transcriptional regulator